MNVWTATRASAVFRTILEDTALPPPVVATAEDDASSLSSTLDLERSVVWLARAVREVLDRLLPAEDVEKARWAAEAAGQAKAATTRGGDDGTAGDGDGSGATSWGAPKLPQLQLQHLQWPPLLQTVAEEADEGVEEAEERGWMMLRRRRQRVLRDHYFSRFTTAESSPPLPFEAALRRVVRAACEHQQQQQQQPIGVLAVWAERVVELLLSIPRAERSTAVGNLLEVWAVQAGSGYGGGDGGANDGSSASDSEKVSKPKAVSSKMATVTVSSEGVRRAGGILAVLGEC